MKRKILIAIVILLGAVFALCLAYAAALKDALSALPEKAPENESIVSGTVGTTQPVEPDRDSTLDTASDEKNDDPGTNSAGTNETAPIQTEHTEPPSTSETTEPTEETAALETDTTETLDPDELPFVPNA